MSDPFGPLFPPLFPESPAARALRKKLKIPYFNETYISSDLRELPTREAGIEANVSAEQAKGLPPCPKEK